MRFAINQIILAVIFILAFLGPFAGNAHAFDTTKEESTCVEIGFKRRTEAFAGCVMELLKRRNKVLKKQVIGDGSSQDQICRKYGFKLGTTSYSECRQKLDIAKQQAEQQQMLYEEQKRQYDAQMAAYEEAKKEASRQEGILILQGLASGSFNGFPTGLVTPVAPVMPGVQQFTIHQSNGTYSYCTYANGLMECR